VAALLREALMKPASWSAVLSGSRDRLVVLREEKSQDQIRIHPLSLLTVKQNLVPLGLRITKYGNAPVAGGAKEFRLVQVDVGGRTVSARAVRDHFAPGQYRDMSDDEKLSSPSFELLEAGVTIGAEQPECGTAVTSAAQYEEIVIPAPAPPQGRGRYTMEASMMSRVGGWKTTKRKAPYRAAAIALAARRKVYKVVSKTDLTRPGVAVEFGSRVEAHDAFGNLSRSDRARLQVVAEWR
jgi:hypothetical protein